VTAPAVASTYSGPVETSLAAASDPVGPSTPPAIGPPPATVAPPPRRAPAAAHPSDCNPPFTWDDQGKKRYKRHCL
jgi:hypothetical protein